MIIVLHIYRYTILSSTEKEEIIDSKDRKLGSRPIMIKTGNDDIIAIRREIRNLSSNEEYDSLKTDAEKVILAKDLPILPGAEGLTIPRVPQRRHPVGHPRMARSSLEFSGPSQKSNVQGSGNVTSPIALLTRQLARSLEQQHMLR